MYSLILDVSHCSKTANNLRNNLSHRSRFEKVSKQKDVCLQSESRDGRSDQVKARAGHLKELLPILQESKTGPPYQEQNKNQIRVKGIARKAPSHRGTCHVFFYFL